jgi:hypothetical protein
MSQGPDFSQHSEYFAARAIAERRMAMAARNPHAREIHLEMAERYAEAAKADEGRTVQPAEDSRRVG